jgi:hypothetical protein
MRDMCGLGAAATTLTLHNGLANGLASNEQELQAALATSCLDLRDGSMRHRGLDSRSHQLKTHAGHRASNRRMEDTKASRDKHRTSLGNQEAAPAAAGVLLAGPSLHPLTMSPSLCSTYAV